MNTYIFLYPETSFFEVNLVAYFMNTVGNVYVAAEDEHVAICTNEGIKIQKDINLSDIDDEGIDALIICGGEISNVNDTKRLSEIIRKCVEKKKIVGGICAGRNLISNAIENLEYEEKTCIQDNIVLSPGNEYVDFALAVGKCAGIFADEDDYNETVDYFKHFKSPR